MTRTIPPPAFFFLSESAELGQRVCREAGLAATPLEERRFEGGEFKLRPLESVRGRTAYVLQSLAGCTEASASERLLRLLFLLNGLRDAGALHRVALVPYLAFARKDRRTQPRDPVSTRYVAELLECTGVDRVVALDVHNPAAFDNSFRIPTDHLTALPMMVDHFARRITTRDCVVASPDVGGVKRAQIFRELLETRLGREVELAFIEKRRAAGIVSGGTLVGNVAQRDVIVLDDLCATGGTLIRAASTCRAAGASAVHVVVTHAPIPEGLQAAAAADGVSSVVVTDSALRSADHISSSAAGKLTVLSVAELFGHAVQRMRAGRPLAPLLTRWPISLEE